MSMKNFFIKLVEFALEVKNSYNGSDKNKFFSCIASAPMINGVKEEINAGISEQAVSTSIQSTKTVLEMLETYLLQNYKSLTDVFKNVKIWSQSQDNYETCEKLLKEANSIEFNLPDASTHDISAPATIHEINILSDIMDIMKFIVNYIVYLTNALNNWVISITPSTGEALKHMSSEDIAWYFFILFLLFLLFFLIVRTIHTSWEKIKQRDNHYVPNVGQVLFFSMLVGLQLSFVVIAYVITVHLLNNSM